MESGAGTSCGRIMKEVRASLRVSSLCIFFPLSHDMRVSICHVFVTEEAGDMHRGGRLSLGPVSATGAAEDVQGSETEGRPEHRAIALASLTGAGGQGRCHSPVKAWLVALVLETLPNRLTRKGLTLLTCLSLCLVLIKD